MSFHFKQFSITNQTAGLKVNTDGCLLGALSNFPLPERCMDIGTGTGVIALMLAQKYPYAEIVAIELNDTACQQAYQNIQSSQFSQRIKLIQKDFLHFEDNGKFDLIVCNPPYFSNHLKGTDVNKNMALHNDHLPQQKLLEKVNGLLSDKGLFMVIYPPSEMQVMQTLAIKEHLHIVHHYRVENKQGNHYRTIMGFSKTKLNTIKETIVLMDEHDQRTEQFAAIMKDFYL